MSPPITIASVRTVSIIPVAPAAPDTVASTRASTPPAGEPAQQSVSVSPPPGAAASATPKLDFAALRRAIIGSDPTDMAPPPAAAASRTITAAPAATAPAASDETIIAKASQVLPPATRAPSTLEEQVALLDSAPATAPDNLPATATPVAFAAPARAPSIPARAPSTLGAQAASIAVPANAAAAAPSMHLSGPPGQPPALSAAAPAIQIGAYSSPQEAERQLAAVQARAQAALTGTTPISRRVESGGRQLYAARFAGLDQAASTKACLELRQQSIDCFVVQSK